jgi:hypothetical protein
MTWQLLNVTDEIAIKVAQRLVDDINQLSGNGNSLCAKLELQTIQIAQVQKLDEKMEEYLLPQAPRPSKNEEQEGGRRRSRKEEDDDGEFILCPQFIPENSLICDDRFKLF